MRGIALTTFAVWLLALSGCSVRQVTDMAIKKVVPDKTKAAAKFVVKALEADRAEIALAPAKAVSEKLGEPEGEVTLPAAPPEGEPETEEAKAEAEDVATEAIEATNARWAAAFMIFNAVGGLVAAARRAAGV